jgi:O-antigen ligase
VLPVENGIARAGLWPAGFAPLRQAWLVIFCVIAWGGILAVLAVGNSLLGLKTALLLLAGARMEPVLGAASLHSVDVAVVLAGFVLVAGAGYIHVSLGLAVVLALRPWLDGFTYPTDNFYFLWAVLYLLGLWSVRQLCAPQPIRGTIPLALLSVFLGWCVISALNSIQFDATYRELLYWVGYAAMFFLAINATPHATSRRLVLIGLFAGMAGQALFAYPHLWYILPWLREYLQEDPRRLAQWFQGATEFTPELARRFNLNRAFASMVFPNALAALFILGIPASLACAWNGIGALRTPMVAGETRVTAFRWLVPWALLLFVAMCLPLYLLGQLALAYPLDGPPWFGSARILIYLSVAVGALAVTTFLFAARRYGLARAGLGAGAVSVVLLFPLLCGALWITYSRGAMLALVVALIWCGVVQWGRGVPLRFNRKSMSAILLGLGIFALLLLGPATAQDSPAAPGNTVTGEGMDITVRELADPGSMRLRLSYWRVALSVGLDNSGTGVGLGNFRVAYGPYQYLGAGDVQNAHNAVLQSWCETGLPGALALIAFWGYFLWTGMRLIRATADQARRNMFLGLYGGVLAFLLHSLLDINFSHPSLVLYVMAVAGLFYSYSLSADAPVGPRARWVAVPLLVLAALAGGAAFRPFLLDLSLNGGRFVNVSNRALNDSRHNAALFFLSDCTTWASGGKASPPPSIPVSDAISLLDDRETLFTVGRILAPDPERRRMVPLAKESALPPGAVFQIVRPWDAREDAFFRMEVWVAELERLDRRFPCDPQVAWQLSGLYKLMAGHTDTLAPERKAEILAAMLSWAEVAVARSPLHKDMHQALAWAHWTLGIHTPGPAGLRHFEAALEAFERSCVLGHNEPNYYFSYGEALAALGGSYENAGRASEGERYREKAEQVRAEGARIQDLRWRLGLQ